MLAERSAMKQQPMTNSQEPNANQTPGDRVCPRCGESLAQDQRTGRIYCSSCGTRFAERLGHEWDDTGPKGIAGREPQLPQVNRRQLLVCFWTLFVFAPLSVPLILSGSEWLSDKFPATPLNLVPVWFRVLGSFCLCHVGAAYCLAKLCSAEPGDVLRDTVLFSIVLVFAYFGVGYLLFMVIGLAIQFIKM